MTSCSRAVFHLSENFMIFGFLHNFHLVKQAKCKWLHGIIKPEFSQTGCLSSNPRKVIGPIWRKFRVSDGFCFSVVGGKLLLLSLKGVPKKVPFKFGVFPGSYHFAAFQYRRYQQLQRYGAYTRLFRVN